MPIAPMPWLSRPAPQGTIEIWTGTIATIPTGWALCDGLNGTPNLLAKFVQGVTTAVTEPGTLGGLDTVTLTSSQISAHNHTSVAYTHQHTSNNGGAGSGGARRTATGETSPPTSQYVTSSTTPPSQNLIATGSNGAHDNVPPFYQVAYIIKL